MLVQYGRWEKNMEATENEIIYKNIFQVRQLKYKTYTVPHQQHFVYAI